MTFRQLGCAILVLAGLSLPLPLAAQSAFSPVITVNEAAITGYELDQRVMLLTFFNTPGDVSQQARDGLIDDRLRSQALARAGLALNEEGLAQALEEFAGRANMTGEQFVTVLQQNGIDETTLRDYVSIGVAWRDFVRSVYSDRATVSEAEIDYALAHQATASTGVEVLLTEIIIPAPPDQAAEVEAAALEISRITSFEAFEAEARRVSAVPSRENGGRLDWTPLGNYPGPLQDVLLGLQPGQVTPPLNITNAIALLQLRAVRESRTAAQTPSLIDYAALYIPGGRTAAAQSEARDVSLEVDTCNDLFQWVRDRNLPAERIDRQSQAPGDIPQDIALELAKLDANEVSTALTTANGDALIFLMLCGRTAPLPEGLTRDDVRSQLRSQKLAAYADAVLADERAAATIVGE